LFKTCVAMKFVDDDDDDDDVDPNALLVAGHLGLQGYDPL